MGRTRLLLALLLTLPALALLAPSAARADQGAAVVRDCTQHGTIQGHYSQQAYRQALAELPADVREYTDCARQIEQARLAAARGGANPSGAGGGGGSSSGGGGSGGAGVISAAERKQLALARSAGGRGVPLGGQVIRPGVVHASIGSAINSLPTPLLAVLAALVAAGLLAAASMIRNGVRARSRNR